MVEAVKVNHNLSRLPYVSVHGLVKEPCACIWLDVNECEAKPCSQECTNVYGSYQCYCRRGYQLSDIDGITCEGSAGFSCQLLLNYITSGLRFTFHFLSDIDECALPAGGHLCSYRCSNVPGSFYCTCPPTGYTLAPNGRTCQGQLVVLLPNTLRKTFFGKTQSFSLHLVFADIDECATGSHNCSASESCFNVQGGFRCLSFSCPLNFRESARG